MRFGTCLVISAFLHLTVLATTSMANTPCLSFKWEDEARWGNYSYPFKIDIAAAVQCSPVQWQVAADTLRGLQFNPYMSVENLARLQQALKRVLQIQKAPTAK